MTKKEILRRVKEIQKQQGDLKNWGKYFHIAELQKARLPVIP